MKPTLYLETSVVSYYTARPSRDILVAVHQQITRRWWDRDLDEYEVFVSQLVIKEASEGDPEAAKKRLEAMASFAVLDFTPEADRLAATYARRIPMLEADIRDAAHVATATMNEVDYLVTWNCAHIASAETRRAVIRENERLGKATPMICTPEELMRP